MRHRCIGAFALAALSPTAGTAAPNGNSTVPTLSSPITTTLNRVIRQTETPAIVPGPEATVPNVTTDYLLQPSISNSDSGSSWGTGLEYDVNYKNDPGSYSLIGTYTDNNPKGASGYSEYYAEGDVSVTKPANPLQAVLTIGYDKALTQAHTLLYSANLTHNIGSVSLSGIVTYVQSTADSGEKISGLKPSLVAVLPTSNQQLSLIGVYILNNDVDKTGSFQAGANAILNSAKTTSVRALIGSNNSVSAILTLKF